MTKKNELVSGLLRYQFRMEIMVPHRSKEVTKKSEGIIVSFPVSIQGKQENMEDRGSRSSRAELKKTLIHKCHIPVNH